MNRIERFFAARQGPLFIPYVTCGLPNLATTKRLIHLMEEEGVHLIELGVPYSDPLADGPVIQQASQRALQGRVNLDGCLTMAQEARREGAESGFILFSYFNPLYQYGLENLFVRLAESGFDGIIIPDLPLEESGLARRLGETHQIHLIPLAAPTSRDRLIQIAAAAQGMVYCVSSLGVTGVRQQFHDNLQEMVEQVKQATPLPVAVGFGVSTLEQFHQLSRFADGVVIGSAFVKRVLELADALDGPDRQAAEEELRQWLRPFTQAQLSSAP